MSSRFGCPLPRKLSMEKVKKSFVKKELLPTKEGMFWQEEVTRPDLDTGGLLPVVHDDSSSSDCVDDLSSPSTVVGDNFPSLQFESEPCILNDDWNQDFGDIDELKLQVSVCVNSMKGANPTHQGPHSRALISLTRLEDLLAREEKSLDFTACSRKL
jgi:hypothetical protein